MLGTVVVRVQTIDAVKEGPSGVVDVTILGRQKMVCSCLDIARGARVNTFKNCETKWRDATIEKS